MRNWKDKNLDERELQIRGGVALHTMLFGFALLLLVTMLDLLGLFYIEQPFGYLLVLLLMVAMLCMEMIYHEVYPIGEKRQRFLYYVLGAYGIIVLPICIMAYKNGEVFFVEKTVTQNGVLAGMAVVYIAVCLFYIMRSRKSKQKPVADEIEE